ncbi:MAG: acyltransferase family protein [bacterium]
MTAEPGRFRPDIEGLRGAAILLVVAFHAGVSRLAGGYVGVDVFFVLSGFLITGLLAREVAETGEVDLAEFYSRRARRLLPALLVVLLVTLAAALWFYAPIDQLPIASDARAVALHYGNVLFARNAVDYHGASGNPFLHTWSLAVEEQFYVIWPLLFVLVARWYGGKNSVTKPLLLAVSVAGAVSFGLSLWITRVSQPWAFFGMPTRIWEFALGGIAALALSRTSQWAVRTGVAVQIGGLIAIGIAAVSYHDTLPYPGIAAVLPALGTAALLVGGHRAPAGAVSRVLGARIFQWFGRVSYSWYLWHWPLVGIGAAINWEIGVGGKLAWSAGALVLAVLTLRFVEQPFRNGELFRTRPQMTTAAAFGASIAAALIAFGGMSIARQNASSPEQRRFAAARDDGMAHECWGSLLENASAPCEFGDPRARTTVVLMGDSHAEHWLPAVDRIGREHGWRVIAMVKPACPVADVTTLVNWRLKRQYTECTLWRRSMLRRIVTIRPDMVILSSYDHYVARNGEPSGSRVTAAAWRDGLRRTYRLLSEAGITTVVIRGTPSPGFDVPACLSRRASKAPFRAKPCEYDFGRSLVAPAIAAQNDAARGLGHLAFVDVNDRICSGRVCPVVQRGEIVFRDDGHLTASFSVATAPVLESRITAAVTKLAQRR